MRIRDLFDIAKIYPESAPAIRDLAWCMKTCDLQRVLIRVFRHSCATRLHIPGVNSLVAMPAVSCCLQLMLGRA